MFRCTSSRRGGLGSLSPAPLVVSGVLPLPFPFCGWSPSWAAAGLAPGWRVCSSPSSLYFVGMQVFRPSPFEAIAVLRWSLASSCEGCIPLVRLCSPVTVPRSPVVGLLFSWFGPRVCVPLAAAGLWRRLRLAVGVSFLRTWDRPSLHSARLWLDCGASLRRGGLLRGGKNTLCGDPLMNVAPPSDERCGVRDLLPVPEAWKLGTHPKG